MPMTYSTRLDMLIQRSIMSLKLNQMKDVVRDYMTCPKLLYGCIMTNCYMASRGVYPLLILSAFRYDSSIDTIPYALYLNILQVSISIECCSIDISLWSVSRYYCLTTVFEQLSVLPNILCNVSACIVYSVSPAVLPPCSASCHGLLLVEDWFTEHFC